MKTTKAKPSSRAARRAKGKNRYAFPVVIERDEEGYFAVCPALQGCYTQGETYEEALENIEGAIRLHVEDRLENGETVPTCDVVSFMTMEVQI